MSSAAWGQLSAPRGVGRLYSSVKSADSALLQQGKDVTYKACLAGGLAFAVNNKGE
ncbi:MAG: hypothetical protein JRI31_01900 [Deltaproteobacteria bacterium]|nr:hypothetical protein [Deltaproteobacteria bacterium]